MKLSSKLLRKNLDSRRRIKKRAPKTEFGASVKIPLGKNEAIKRKKFESHLETLERGKLEIDEIRTKLSKYLVPSCKKMQFNLEMILLQLATNLVK